jgi:hypothetical protein
MMDYLMTCLKTLFEKTKFVEGFFLYSHLKLVSYKDKNNKYK